MSVRYEFDTRPGIGETCLIAEGIAWLRMPLPFMLGHINLWLLEDDDGWTIVDTGIHTDTSKDVWRRTIAGMMAGQRLQSAPGYADNNEAKRSNSK